MQVASSNCCHSGLLLVLVFAAAFMLPPHASATPTAAADDLPADTSAKQVIRMFVPQCCTERSILLTMAAVSRGC